MWNVNHIINRNSNEYDNACGLNQPKFPVKQPNNTHQGQHYCSDSKDGNEADKNVACGQDEDGEGKDDTE